MKYRPFVKLFSLAQLLLLTTNALAQVPVPQVQLPPSIIAELRRVETRFESAIAQDCPAEKCFSKGCTYLAHETVDKPKSSSLPGLGDPQAGPGSAGPAQEYLKAARCEFAFESTLAARDISALQRRLEQKLSVGFLVVTVEPKPLPPLPASLKVTPPPPGTQPQLQPTASPAKTSEDALKDLKDWNAQTASRELWLQLLPHFSWMIAIALGTGALLVLLWGWRRVGKETLEEKAFLASLDKSEPAPATEIKVETPIEAVPTGEKSSFSPEELKAHLKLNNEKLKRVLDHWLNSREHALIAKALHLFGDDASSALNSIESRTIEKAELAEFVRNTNNAALPADQDFKEALQGSLLSTSIEANADVALYQALGREFNAAGIGMLLQRMPERLAAIVFSIMPKDLQRPVAHSLDQNYKATLTNALLTSSRATAQELNNAFDYVKAALAGSGLPNVKDLKPEFEHGRQLDTTGAIAALLPAIPSAQRKELVKEQMKKPNFQGAAWAGHIFFAEMLLRVPREIRSSFFFEVDPKDLFVWFNQVPSTVRDGLAADIPSALQSVMKTFHMPAQYEASAAFVRVERRFLELLKREYSLSKLKFEELI